MQEVDVLGERKTDIELDELRREIEELRASRRRLAVADDAERRNIERALHDDVQQELVGLAAGLELAARSVDTDPTAAKALLQEMGRDVSQALDDARNLAHRIFPAPARGGRFGPGAALGGGERGRPDPHRRGGGSGVSAPRSAGMVYACCLQVLERAGAGTQVTVTVRNDERTLGFEVLADCDLEAERLPLRDRVEALGGRLTFSSEPEHRTRLVGSVPLSG